MTTPNLRLCEVNMLKYTVKCYTSLCVENIYNEISLSYGMPFNDYYLLKNGKKLNNFEFVDGEIKIVPRLIGGKGGFGSMLRAIGAQIEKTTNREACRDLSGRRLRDINEEQRLKNWIAQQADREREAVERKQKKLERLCQEPKHDFKDETYEKERSELTEKVSSSVEEGFKKAGTSGISVKRTQSGGEPMKKKKRKLWIDADDDLSSSGSELEECTSVSTVVSKVDENQTTDDK